MNQVDQTVHYDQIWRIGHVWSPMLWPEWKILVPLLPTAHDRLEIGAGLRPRLPIQGTRFVDLSHHSLRKLSALGGIPIAASADGLPFAAEQFDLIAACELIEHLPDDQAVMGEIARVLRPGGHFLISVPLQPGLWTEHDILAGHYRRYTPEALSELLKSHGFTVIGFCPQIGEGYSRLKKLGAWTLKQAPRFAIWLEDRVTLPVGVRLQRKTRRWLPEFPLDTKAPGGFLLCRKSGSPTNS